VNPYRALVGDLARLHREGASLPLGGLPPAPAPPPDPAAGCALVFAPHPDDESLTGGLALRLRRQLRMRVVAVAVTAGRDERRRSARVGELRAACAFLGFEAQSAELEPITLAARSADLRRWQAAVAVVAALLVEQQPRVVFCPHAGDRHPTHVGTHHLVVDALARLPAAWSCRFVETEYWAPLERPNLLVESAPDDVADLVAATSFHAGEVRRNPYHLSLPAWMQDNVRRGAELVRPTGSAAPAFTFATLYRWRRWRGGLLAPALDEGRFLPAAADPSPLFAEEDR
jgi:LmbE family N-acetylglucosaminyl deacetylase